MGIHAIKLPDVGEGVAEAELVEWPVAVGDVVRVDEVIAVVMTDKASVEIPTPVEGKIAWLGGEVGDTLAVGSDLIRIEVDGDGNVAATDAEPVQPPVASAEPIAADEAKPDMVPEKSERPSSGTSGAPRSMPRRAEGEKPLAAPSVRKRARDAGIDLRAVAGTGPAGRITHDDIDTYRAGDGNGTAIPNLAAGRRTRQCAKSRWSACAAASRKKMALAKAKIPHITIVEEIDMTNLEDLRKDSTRRMLTHGPS